MKKILFAGLIASAQADTHGSKVTLEPLAEKSSWNVATVADPTDHRYQVTVTHTSVIDKCISIFNTVTLTSDTNYINGDQEAKIWKGLCSDTAPATGTKLSAGVSKNINTPNESGVEFTTEFCIELLNPDVDSTKHYGKLPLTVNLVT